MKSLLSILLVFTFVLGVFSSIAYERIPYVEVATEDARSRKSSETSGLGHRGECFDKATKKFYQINEEVPWDQCGRKTCTLLHRHSLMFEYQACGAMGYPKECKKVVDSTLPYPECCGKIICPPFDETKTPKNNSSSSSKTENLV